MEEQQILQQTGEYLTWGFNNVEFLFYSLGGAICGYLFYQFPEAKRIKEVLRGLGLDGLRLARTEFLVTTLMGTFVVATLVRPDSAKAAFLAGFAWLGLLRSHRADNDSPTVGAKSDEQS